MFMSNFRSDEKVVNFEARCKFPALRAELAGYAPDLSETTWKLILDSVRSHEECPVDEELPVSFTENIQSPSDLTARLLARVGSLSLDERLTKTFRLAKHELAEMENDPRVVQATLEAIKLIDRLLIWSRLSGASIDSIMLAAAAYSRRREASLAI